VICDEKGDPKEGIKLEAKIPGTNELIFTYSNADGTYGLSGLPPGDLEISLFDTLSFYTHGSPVKKRKIVTMPPSGVVRVDFTCGGSCSIYGSCSYDRKRDWGMAVNIINEKGITILTTVSAVDGYYMFHGIPPGRYTLEARSGLAGLGGAVRRPIELSPGEELKLDIDIAGKAVSGRVKGPDGKPADAADVDVLTPSLQRIRNVVADHEGRYAILGLDEGDYLVAARGEGLAEEIKGPFSLGGARPVRSVDFDLEPGGLARIRASENNGGPVSGAVVLLSDDFSKGVLRRGVTGYSGMCVFDSLETGAFQVLAGAGGFAPAGAKLNALPNEKADLDIALAPGGSFRVQVVNADGAPLIGASVAPSGFSLFGLTPYRLSQLGFLDPSDARFRTDRSGAFVLGPLPAGAITLRVTGNGLVRSTDVTIAPGRESPVRVAMK